MLTAVTAEPRATTSRQAVAGIRLAALLAVLAGIAWAPELEVRGASLLALTTLLLSVSGCAVRHRLGALRPVLFYVYVLAFFHLGLAGYFVLGASPPDFGVFLNQQTLRDPLLPQAIAVAGAAIGAVALGAMATDLFPQAQRHRVSPPDASRPERDRAALIGGGLLLASTLTWAYVGVSRIGLGFVGASYGEWLIATAGSPLPYVYAAISIGLLLAVASGRSLKSPIYSPFWLFGVFALVLGLRNEVVVPVAAAAAVRVLQGGRFRVRRVVAGAAILLTILGTIRVTRTDGLGGGLVAPSPSHATAAIAEMGYSVRVIAFVQDWQQDGEPLYWGGTYWAPAERLLANLIEDWNPPSVQNDVRASETVVTERVGPVGFSAIAEALRNFPPIGAIVFMFLQGLLLGALERRADSLRNILILGVVLNALMLHARNSFTPVPLQIGLGLVAVALVCRPRFGQP